MTAPVGMNNDGRVPMAAGRRKMRRAFTDLVGCEVPIQLAPMGAICSSQAGDLLREQWRPDVQAVRRAPVRTRCTR